MNLNGTEHIQREFFIRERDLKSNLLLRKKQQTRPKEPSRDN